jgi:FMN phosphatase YigB (HAD superfamily)
MKKKIKIICFDIDNTLCTTKNSNYKNSKPINKNISLVNQLHTKNYYIKIFTSRFMRRSKEKSSLARRKGFDFTKKQLKSWGLKYNELIFGKPSFDLLIDDRAIFFQKNWQDKIKKFLK